MTKIQKSQFWRESRDFKDMVEFKIVDRTWIPIWGLEYLREQRKKVTKNGSIKISEDLSLVCINKLYDLFSSSSKNSFESGKWVIITVFNPKETGSKFEKWKKWFWSWK